MRRAVAGATDRVWRRLRWPMTPRRPASALRRGRSLACLLRAKSGAAVDMTARESGPRCGAGATPAHPDGRMARGTMVEYAACISTDEAAERRLLILRHGSSIAQTRRYYSGEYQHLSIAGIQRFITKKKSVKTKVHKQSAPASKIVR